MVEIETIEGIFRNLDVYLAQLRRIGTGSQDELANDPIRLGAAKYYLQVAVECCIDVANHIISREGFRAPESYADSFTVLAENGILEQGFVPTTHKMVKMRNRLVHLYWELDAAILYDTLQHNLDDFDRFRAFVYGFIRGREQGAESV